ncbi:MAG: 1,4-alpha-glucan branching protein GlgB [Chthoniobacterales bacterium]|nr:1,4-alpha-glucan branching protein GlgB [Chthoniobacterales bacterium]
MIAPLSDDDFYPLLEIRHSDPHRLLGIHRLDQKTSLLRIWYPGAVAVTAAPLSHGRKACSGVTLRCIHSNGLFEAETEAAFFETEEGAPIAYQLSITTEHGKKLTLRDPYSFAPHLTEFDLYLLSEGKHWEAYKRLGAHSKIIDGASGTLFALWAPNAQRVSVVGDFNHWDGRYHMMRRLGSSGIWEIFLPGVQEGAHYKYELRGPHGDCFLKTDPYGFFAQHDLDTACMVYNLDRYQWNDAQWLAKRHSTDLYRAPLSIYEVHLGSWRRVPGEGDRPLSYRELAQELVQYVKEMGFTHIELMPMMEHPFEGSWGYQVVNYYAPSSRFGKPDEFRYLIDCLHQAGIGVLLDWVPGHFPKDAHGLYRYDGTALYEHEDPRRGEHYDWGTMIFNYGRKEVRNFLIANALYWLAEYHIDGLRVDAVASMIYLDYSRKEGEWIPNQFGGRENLEAISFIKECNELCYSRHPGIMMIAEESTAWSGVSKPTYTGGLGFGFKWNMGWMNDSLRYISRSPIHRKHHQSDITFSMLYAYHEHFILVLSHDEVVHGKQSLLSKMPEDDWQQFANLRLFLAWMWSHPGKKLLFQGGEFAQRGEWNHAHSLDWHLLQYAPHQGMHRLVQRLNHLYTTESAFWTLDDQPEGFEWIDFNDSDNSVWSFLRKAPSLAMTSEEKNRTDILVIVNATPVIRHHYRLGVPKPGAYEILLNSDDSSFYGSSMPLPTTIYSQPHPYHRFGASIALDLPPLSTLYLRVPVQ